MGRIEDKEKYVKQIVISPKDYIPVTDAITKETKHIEVGEFVTVGVGVTVHSALDQDDGKNPHGTTRANIGLSEADNTSDKNKPISDATQVELDKKANSEDFSNVDNTSDLDKPISNDTQTALDDKANNSDISEIDNTSDANKPISLATQAALDLKEDLGVYISKSSNYTITINNKAIRCTGNFDLTFYTAVGNKGARIQLKNSGIGKINLIPNASETLEKESSQELLEGDSHDWISDGANWEII